MRVCISCKAGFEEHVKYRNMITTQPLDNPRRSVSPSGSTEQLAKPDDADDTAADTAASP